MINLKSFKIFKKEIYLKESGDLKNILDNSFSIEEYKLKSCDIKYTEAGSKNYWNISAPTEFTKKIQIDQKINSIKQRIDPIFKRTKEYYIKYTGSPYFTKKIREKSEKQGRKWEPSNKASLDKFINSIYYRTYPPNVLPYEIKKTESSGQTLAWVEVSGLIMDKKTKRGVPAYNLININLNSLTNNFSEEEMSNTLVHEMKHCIDGYFVNQGLDIVPGYDDYARLLALISNTGKRKLTPQEEQFLENYSKKIDDNFKKSYLSNEFENSARYQNLKSGMGIDDFGTFENFISLLKENLKGELVGWDRKKLDWIKIKDLELDFTGEGKIKIPNPSGEVLFSYRNIKLGVDISHLIYNFKEKSKDKNETVINLKKLYNHSLEFAKNDLRKGEKEEQVS